MTPRVLDLCCGAGGATAGYQRAGFHVIGVDEKPQFNYCGDGFAYGDVVDVLEMMIGRRNRSRRHGFLGNYELQDFAAIHVSPPCQRYIRGGLSDKEKHPDLLPTIRGLLMQTGVPWIIENVPGAPMRADAVLCGSMFGLPIRRHRWFETSWGEPILTPPCDHSRPIVGVYGHPHGKAGAWPGMLPGSLETWKAALGVPWMKTAREVSEAIPPAYTEFIGRHLMQHVQARAVA